MQKFEELLQKIARLKKEYAAGQIKINAAGVFTLIMSGAMDSLIKEEGEVSLVERLAAIERFKKATGSSAQLPKAKGEALGMCDIEDEFGRRAWLSSINPVFSFYVCDYFKEALASIGFSSTGTKHLRYRKEKTDFSAPVDIFGSFASLFLPKTLQIYGNRNMVRKPAIVGIYKGYNTQSWGNGNQFRKLKISDGTTVGEGTVWPIRGTNDYEHNLANQMNSCHGKACLFIGRVGVSKKGYKSFTVERIIPFS